VRVESFNYNQKDERRATEVQNLQIIDGDPLKNVEVPLHMQFPKVYACPTYLGDKFKIEFEINVIVIFINGYQVTENYPMRLYR